MIITMKYYTLKDCFWNTIYKKYRLETLENKLIKKLFKMRKKEKIDKNTYYDIYDSKVYWDLNELNISLEQNLSRKILELN